MNFSVALLSFSSLFSFPEARHCCGGRTACVGIKVDSTRFGSLLVGVCVCVVAVVWCGVLCWVCLVFGLAEAGAAACVGV